MDSSLPQWTAEQSPPSLDKLIPLSLNGDLPHPSMNGFPSLPQWTNGSLPHLVLESLVFWFFNPFFELEHCNKNSL